MQQRILFVVALLVAPAVASSASNTATAWLQSHKSPTDNQLGQLASANPAAFAIVQALLNKHAKGEIKLSAEERGPDVFRNMMTPRHLSSAAPNAAVPYASAELAEVRRPVVDQAHYNPSAAADRDESAVSRLLDAVSQLGGKKGKQIALLKQRRSHSVVANTLTNDASLFADAEPAPAPVQVKAVEAQVAAAVQAPVQEPATPAPKAENSYLKGIDLSGDMPKFLSQKKAKHAVVEDGSDSITSFSFDDSAPTTPAPKKVAPPKKENMFLKWLSVGKKAPAPVEQKVVQPAPAATNPYSNWMGF